MSRLLSWLIRGERYPSLAERHFASPLCLVGRFGW